MRVFIKRELKLVILSWLVHLSYTSTILFYMGAASLGNRIAVWPLIMDLNLRGHTVNILSIHPGEVVSDPKVTEISIRAAIRKFGSTVSKDPLQLRQEHLHQVYWDFMPIDGLLVCEAILKDKKTKDWVKEAKYDLVILDSHNNDCGLGLSHLFGAKIILLGSSSLLMWHPDAFGFPAETSWIPDLQRHFPQEMTYIQRIRNTIRAVRWHIFREAYLFPQHEKLFKLYLEEHNLPPMRDIEKSISLALVNSHFTHEFARSLPPSVVPVGGMHIAESNKPLPKEISEFIGQKEFIYVSFGSSITLSRLEASARNVLLTTLNGLNVRVIMKLNEDDFVGEIGSNIYAKSWLPQQDILAHSRVRGLVCHGGTHSIQEAIYHAVPVVVLPVFRDQDFNAERINKLGCGVRLEINDLTTEKFQTALDQLFHNSNVLDNMRTLSTNFKDRPMKPLDLAIWWIEYVMRRNDTDSLKPFAINQTWFERRLLDVWLPIFIATLISIIVIAWYIKFAISSFVFAIQEYVFDTEMNAKDKKS